MNSEPLPSTVPGPEIADSPNPSVPMELLAGVATCEPGAVMPLLEKFVERVGPDTLQQLLNGLRDSSPTGPVFETAPQSLSPVLRPVPSLTPAMLPARLRGFCCDISQRGSFPLEYVAIPALVALASVVGRFVGIRPKQHDEWIVPGNLWGAIVGPPGVFKTPATAEALKPLQRLEVLPHDANKAEVAEWEHDKQIAEAQNKASKAKLLAAAKSGKSSPAQMKMLASETASTDMPKPTLRRFVVNDATAEMAQVLCQENPGGYLCYRDELSGWLKTLDKQGHENDRSFYLESWNGTGSYTVDRIGRGTIFCESVCLSVLGGIQPGILARYLRKAIDGDEADGLMPRFQLMVFPDPPRRFVNVDRYPDTETKQAVWELFQRLSTLRPSSVGAQSADGETDLPIPFLRFSPDAQPVFTAWRVDLENRLRSGGESPAIIPVLSKYRSLCPKLALLFHLASDTAFDQGSPDFGAVPLSALELAIEWCAFLEAHTRRVYQSAYDAPVEAAQTLSDRLKERLPNPFTIPDIVRKGWGGLSDTESVKMAVAVLEERGWVKAVERKPEGGGRPSMEVWINPALGSASGEGAETSFHAEHAADG